MNGVDIVRGFLAKACFLLCLALLSFVGHACGESVTKLDVNVSLGPNYIVLYLTEPDRPCVCTGDSWPNPGECVDVSDVVYCECDPPPGSCLTSARLEKEGEVVSEVIWENHYGTIGLSTGGLSTSFEYFLVMEGCGSSARIPVPTGVFPEPRITDLEHDGDTLTVHWMSDEPGTGSIGSLGSLGGPQCHDVVDGLTRVPCRSFLGSQDSFWLSVFDGGEDIRTGLGTVRVWRGANTGIELYFPRKKDNGLWSLPTMWKPVIRINIDGTEEEGTLHLATAEVDLGGTEPLIDLGGLAFAFEFGYTSGPATDQLLIHSQDIFIGEFPHVTPVDELELGKPETETFILDVGPVTLQKEGDPSTTIDVSFSLTWDIELPVSRPVVR